MKKKAPVVKNQEFYDEEKDFTIIICLIVMGLSINANTNQNFKTKNNAFFLLCRNMFTM